MKKTLLLVATASVLASSAIADDGTTIHGGQILANVLAYVGSAFGVAFAGLVTAVVYKVLGKLGVEVTAQQKEALNSVIVNGLNDASAKAQASVGSNAALDLNVKSQIVASAVAYTQTHAADTIKALGLDPQSGQAVQAIRARMTTLVADPAQPTSETANAAVAGAAAK